MMKRLLFASLFVVALSAVSTSPVSALTNRFDQERQNTLNRLSDRFDKERVETQNKLTERFDDARQQLLDQ